MNRRWFAALLVLALLPPARADEEGPHTYLVIDTDAGLDDVVALTLVLQEPAVDVEAIVVTPGASGAVGGATTVARLLGRMNRSDVALFAGSPEAATPPPFRAAAEEMLGRLLPSGSAGAARPFDPAVAYTCDHGKTTVLVLGPLGSLASALLTKPGIRAGIEAVVVSGSPDGWNARRDPEAVAVVRESGLPLTFVVPGAEGTKPAAWSEGPMAISGHTIGAGILRRLLGDKAAFAHYLGPLAPYHDELAFLYCAEPDRFRKREDGAMEPGDRAGIEAAFSAALRGGRLRRKPVVFSRTDFPPEFLAPDVRERQAAIRAKNGEEEWFAQILMNEIHEHLGAWSIVGVKMAIRAAELLNAPPHSMEVVSFSAAGPPVSCMNDGVIVGSGSTPGRGLFRHEPGPPGSTRVKFTMNGRSVVLALKPEYRNLIAARIAELLEEHTLEDEAYWLGVREMGLVIWQDWHRTEIFDAEAVPEPR
ncbi:MAG: nucleoside hydrolase [Planctomycetes bacterium]|jgi:inosine-uridine nucleoside N-ribohydrolase|nr:nucleoside hydrolase [Planctomycetota bacterium]